MLGGHTAGRLEEYLRFRHLVRNLYTWNFEAARLAELIGDLADLLAESDRDFGLFGDFLGMLGHCDTPDGPQSC